MTTRAPGSCRAMAITDDSPFPISHATTDAGIEGDGRFSSHVASEIILAAWSV
jgi:hypothetical protein